MYVCMYIGTHTHEFETGGYGSGGYGDGQAAGSGGRSSQHGQAASTASSGSRAAAAATNKTGQLWQRAGACYLFVCAYLSKQFLRAGPQSSPRPTPPPLPPPTSCSTRPPLAALSACMMSGCAPPPAVGAVSPPQAPASTAPSPVLPPAQLTALLRWQWWTASACRPPTCCCSPCLMQTAQRWSVLWIPVATPDRLLLNLRRVPTLPRCATVVWGGCLCVGCRHKLQSSQ